MRNSLLKNDYPFFIDPDTHGLFLYYKRLNIWFYILSVLIFLANEVFVRPNVGVYKQSPDALGAIAALTLNAQIPAGGGVPVILAVTFYAFFLLINYFLLPRWGVRPNKAGVKSGLPKGDDYKKAYFYIENSIQENAFVLWNSFSIRLSFFFASFIPCMGINLFRGLS